MAWADQTLSAGLFLQELILVRRFNNLLLTAFFHITVAIRIRRQPITDERVHNLMFVDTLDKL